MFPVLWPVMDMAEIVRRLTATVHEELHVAQAALGRQQVQANPAFLMSPSDSWISLI